GPRRLRSPRAPGSFGPSRAGAARRPPAGSCGGRGSRRHPGQGDEESAAATGTLRLDPGATAVRLHDDPTDVEPHADPGGLTTQAGVDAMEALEDALALLG